jgi:hypothetical protein
MEIRQLKHTKSLSTGMIFVRAHRFFFHEDDLRFSDWQILDKVFHTSSLDIILLDRYRSVSKWEYFYF